VYEWVKLREMPECLKKILTINQIHWINSVSAEFQKIAWILNFVLADIYLLLHPVISASFGA